MILSFVMADSGKMTVERAIRIQSFRTPATRIVIALVLPITRKIEKFKANAQSAFEKNIQKLNRICDTSIPGISKRYHGTKRNTKLQRQGKRTYQVLSMFNTYNKAKY